MASGWTNRGKFLIEQSYFRNTGTPTNFYVALFTAATTPHADINLVSDLTQIATGNGYTDGGFQLARNSTDFDTLTEDDTSDFGEIMVKDVSWTASAGPIPSSGAGARWAALTDDNVTVNSRQVIAWFDLDSAITRADGETLTIQNITLRGT